MANNYPYDFFDLHRSHSEILADVADVIRKSGKCEEYTIIKYQKRYAFSVSLYRYPYDDITRYHNPIVYEDDCIVCHRDNFGVGLIHFKDTKKTFYVSPSY